MENETILVSKITGCNMYPTINNDKKASAGHRFVKGLCNPGLGSLEDRKNDKGRKELWFKRYHPYQKNDAPKEDQEKIINVWKKLNLDFPSNSSSSSLSGSDMLSSISSSSIICGAYRSQLSINPISIKIIITNQQ